MLLSVESNKIHLFFFLIILAHNLITSLRVKLD